ncbi:MAG TPA: YqgE/AlgH family protein [Candidatus Paceibacterota bacterium]|nr:YqgE/AlgH family protein [Verrucomicrobiota bacterium]HRY48310.1 YqgE/AlgH family protein [Candidatus Paceibacterota bacterium]HRZ99553.1 YqgE/AlgH family protein [Candidatus Paceibacterota bacterium]
MHPESLQGFLLLDGGSLRGSFFNRTVVLICQHDAEGAFGLVLNRQSGASVGEILVANLPDALKSQPLYIGGPVQPTAMSYLHSDQFLPDANVMENLSLGHSLDTLIELGESMSVTQKVRIFAGYSGWAAGQLEDEMKRKAWLTHPATLDLVFSQNPDQLWRQILLNRGWQYKLLAEGPEDLSVN